MLLLSTTGVPLLLLEISTVPVQVLEPPAPVKLTPHVFVALQLIQLPTVPVVRVPLVFVHRTQ